MTRFFWAICLFPLLSLSQNADRQDLQCYHADPHGQDREHVTDFKSLDLQLRFEPENGIVRGIADYVLSVLRDNVDTIVLDGPSIKINSCLFNGSPQEVFYRDKQILIPVPNLVRNKEYTLRLDYWAKPERGLYFIGWNDKTQRARKQLWTQGQGIDNRHWIPSYDHQNDKLLTELRIEFDSSYKVISNGDLLSKTPIENGQAIWHYKLNHPHSSYLIMLAIGDFEKHILQANGISIEQYYYPNHPSSNVVLETVYHHSVHMMMWFEKILKVPYQWGNVYRNVPVQDFLYGAMENTTSTIFTDYYLMDKRAALERTYLNTNAHELAHNWFGDLITARSIHHHWLHESFATYYAKRYVRHWQSAEEQAWSKRGEQNSAFRAAENNHLPVAHSRAGSARHYPKGSFVLDMMADEVGLNNFDRVVTHYLENYKFEVVNSDDFLQSFMDVLGRNLDWFFDQWIYRGGEPILEVSTKSVGANDSLVIEQKQVGEGIGAFRMDMPVKFYLKGGKELVANMQIRKADEVFAFPAGINSKLVEAISINHNQDFLCKADVKQDADAWMAIFLRSKNPIERFDALGNIEASGKHEKFFRKALGKEQSSRVYNALLDKLKEINGEKLEAKVIEAALRHENLHVRRKGIALAKDSLSVRVSESLISKMLKQEPSYVNLVRLIELTAEKYPNLENTMVAETNSVLGHNRNVRIAFLKYMTQKGDIIFREELRDYVKNSWGFRVRGAAFAALEEVEDFDKKLVVEAVNLQETPIWRLKRAAGSYLNAAWKANKDLVKTMVIDSQLQEESKMALLSKLEAQEG